MSFLFYILFVVFIVVIDQITKYLTVLYIPPSVFRPLFPVCCKSLTCRTPAPLFPPLRVSSGCLR